MESNAHRVQLLAVAALSGTAIICVLGIVLLRATGHECDHMLATIASTCLGALVGILVHPGNPPPTHWPSKPPQKESKILLPPS